MGIDEARLYLIFIKGSSAHIQSDIAESSVFLFDEFELGSRLKYRSKFEVTLSDSKNLTPNYSHCNYSYHLKSCNGTCGN